MIFTQEHFQAALKLCRDAGDLWSEAVNLMMFATGLHHENKLDDAIESIRSSFASTTVDDLVTADRAVLCSAEEAVVS